MRLIDADRIPYRNGTHGSSYDTAYRFDINVIPTVDPVHAAGGCYCRECINLFMENTMDNTVQPFTEEAFYKARHNGEFVLLYCNRNNRMCGTMDFCSRGRRKEGVDG